MGLPLPFNCDLASLHIRGQEGGLAPAPPKAIWLRCRLEVRKVGLPPTFKCDLISMQTRGIVVWSH